MNIYLILLLLENKIIDPLSTLAITKSKKGLKRRGSRTASPPPITCGVGASLDSCSALTSFYLILESSSRLFCQGFGWRLGWTSSCKAGCQCTASRTSPVCSCIGLHPPFMFRFRCPWTRPLRQCFRSASFYSFCLAQSDAAERWRSCLWNIMIWIA